MANASPYRILLVDDARDTLQLIAEGLEQEGYRVDAALGGKEAISRSSEQGYDVVITDLFMPEVGGMEVLAHFRESYPDTIVIILTGYGTVETAVKAMRKGAFDYVAKPAKMEELLHTIARALEVRALKEENVLLRSQLQERYRFDNIVGQSAPMQALYKMIQRVAKTDSTILILGESGTGKELIANAIHFNSERKDKPFIPINCGAIPEELMESELFGHEKGSFTGAIKERKGRFELAHRGTIFLDEIGEMSQKLQVKLLRILQEKRFERVGGSRTHEVDVRVIAATNKDLDEAVRSGAFREDLFYRLNVIPIHVSALRDRTGDIPLLVHYFLRQHCQKKEIPSKTISKAALSALERYEWPGNVRELENVIERIVILCDSDEIDLEDLPERMRQKAALGAFPLPEIGDGGINLKKTLEDLEYHLIMEALKRATGVKNKAAKLLGLNRTTLIEKMKAKAIVYPPRE